jgi:Immunity protein 42
MMVGVQSEFAIEYELLDRADTFVYGRFRFWIGGLAVGDWDEICTMGALLHSASVFLKFAGERRITAAGASSREMWDYITQVSISDNPTLLHLAIEGRFRQRYLLSEVSDDSVGLHYQILVIDIDNHQKIMWQPLAESNHLREIDVASGTVDSVLSTFVNLATTP